MRARLHVGDLEPDTLVMAEPVTECGPLPDVANALVDAARGQAGRQCRDRNPPLVQGPQELGVAAALLAEQVRGRNPAGREGQLPGVRGTPAHLRVLRPDGEPWRF